MTEGTQEIAKFDPNQFAQQLREKIQLDIATFLPEDVWLKKIEEEVDAFLEGKWEEDSYGYHRDKRWVPSGLTSAVQEIMKERTKGIVRATLDERRTWNDEVSSKVDELIENNLQEIVKAVMGPILQSAFNSMHG